MAFQKRRSGGGSKPAMSVQLSCKVGDGQYEKGPSFGLFINEEGGPAFRSTLKGDYLTQTLEFLSNAYDAGLPVNLAVFDNSEREGKPSGGFKKPGGFKDRKPNPFKKKEQEQEQGPGDEPRF
jgi:hypothetical protein